MKALGQQLAVQSIGGIWDPGRWLAEDGGKDEH